MDKLQQQMAKNGMTFSGIRTQAEASLVASNLAKMSGIDLDLATKIISAARKEQTRRETALTNAKQLQYNALEAMGYVINPITGQLSPTLAKQKAEQPVRFSAGGNVYEYDSTTGTMSTLIEGVGDTPTSYDEWVLAGEQSGTGMSYAEFLSNKGESQTDKDRALKTASFAQAQGALNASKGSDGYVNTALYIKLRSDYAQTIGNAKDFDDVFGHMLNPKDPTASMLIAQIIGI